MTLVEHYKHATRALDDIPRGLTKEQTVAHIDDAVYHLTCISRLLTDSGEHMQNTDK